MTSFKMPFGTIVKVLSVGIRETARACVCVCVRKSGREIETLVGGGKAVTDAVQRQSFNNNLAGETICKRQTLRYCFSENVVDKKERGGFISIQRGSRDQIQAAYEFPHDAALANVFTTWPS